MKRALLRWLFAPVLAVMTIGLLAGCGGGGEGSSSSAPTNGTTGGNAGASLVSITGVLMDKATGILLTGRTVTVQGTSSSGVTNSNGAFSISNVPNTAVTLVIVDASGTSNGTYSVDLSTLSGSPINIGTIQLTVSSNAPPGAPVIGG